MSLAPGAAHAGATHYYLRGTIVHCTDEASATAAEPPVQIIDDGVIEVRDGRIASLGAIADGLRADLPCIDYRGGLLLPGFVDAHTHYPQTGMVAAWGEQLLDWLEQYTFPAEMRFADPQHARRMAAAFVRQLLANGTTTAMVFGTVHPDSVEALFEVAGPFGLQLISGKCLMDRNCPAELRDTAERGYQDSLALARQWHGQQRFHYAVTPRFAPTSTAEQLRAAARLMDAIPDAYLQTHVAENHDEVKWVAELFPKARSYLDVYAHFGLLRSRSVLAHCLHLDDTDLTAFQASGARAAFCPSSNLFLGSGLLDLERLRERGIPVATGTDVGAGTSFNVLRTLGEGYKVAQLGRQRLSPARMLYLATLGGAQALHLAHRCGNFTPGKDADIVVLDPCATELTALRLEAGAGPLETLFVLAMLGDERHVQQTYVNGVAFSSQAA